LGVGLNQNRGKGRKSKTSTSSRGNSCGKRGGKVDAENGTIRQIKYPVKKGGQKSKKVLVSIPAQQAYGSKVTLCQKETRRKAKINGGKKC